LTKAYWSGFLGLCSPSVALQLAWLQLLITEAEQSPKKPDQYALVKVKVVPHGRGGRKREGL
jgi:hypothetical protein